VSDPAVPPIPLGSWVVVIAAYQPRPTSRLLGPAPGTVTRLLGWDPVAGDPMVYLVQHADGFTLDAVSPGVWVWKAVPAMTAAWWVSARPASPDEAQAAQLAELAGQGL
jgi:hypothetical protein